MRKDDLKEPGGVHVAFRRDIAEAAARVDINPIGEVGRIFSFFQTLQDTAEP